MDMETKIKLEEIDGAEGVAPMGLSNNSNRNSLSKPSWLLLTIAELDERIKRLTINIPENESVAHCFGERAEDYYRQRPQLLSLLQDLYNGYISLADRYCQSLSKINKVHRRRFSSPISPLFFTELDQLDGEENGYVNDSDAESSLSFQPPFHSLAATKIDPEMFIADVVMKNVDYDIVVHELNIVVSRGDESSRKIELQKSLLEVLESERLILLTENATMRYRFNALVEENKEMASESLYMKRKAADLARCVLKMREDHRVRLLSRKIEDLQGQIYALEKRNKEYCDQLVKKDENMINQKAKKGKCRESKSGKGDNSGTGLFDVLKGNGDKGSGKKGIKFWDKVKNLDIFLCGPNINSGYC
ncbi:hypothetical protein LIER_11296 [Lithospermum erythrorhizon]|uniref:NAB domain-containing protein n=1 Tax=Lithospermum erythrorhizon TaxID=34254 RepID=A0AAV3PNY4_LITER